jgi:hypothetical protein
VMLINAGLALTKARSECVVDRSHRRGDQRAATALEAVLVDQLDFVDHRVMNVGVGLSEFQDARKRAVGAARDPYDVQPLQPRAVAAVAGDHHDGFGGVRAKATEPPGRSVIRGRIPVHAGPSTAAEQETRS